MNRHFNRRNFLTGAATLSIAGALLPACSRRTGVADLPALRVSTVGKGEADMQLLQNVSNIQAGFLSGNFIVSAPGRQGRCGFVSAGG